MPFMRNSRHLTVFTAALLLSLTSCVCGLVSDLDTGSLDGGARVDGGGRGDGGARDAGPTSTADAGAFDAGTGMPDGGECPPVSCTDQCGPVRDFCRGTVLQCGGCTGGKACDLVNHVCVTPKVDCAQLGAQCGQLRNTCGTRLNCGACSGNLECDRNTHTCVACSNASCQDLGYECGDVWLGCGAFTNKTNCGGCKPGMTCNPGIHKCEPMCTPAADSVLCAAAGAECGVIDNGCGGIATCGTCGTGTGCGARGIGNRCDLPEVPDECLAAYRNCGSMKTVCGAGMIDCGTCPSGQICGVEGRCTDHPDCAAFGAGGDAGSACSNGPSASFPQDPGTNLACPCAAPGRCNITNTRTEAPMGVKGTCCVNTVKCGANECNSTKINECTGEVITCGCTAPGTKCNNAMKRCEVDNGCSSFTTGADGSKCSNGPSTQFPTDAGSLTCPCSAQGAECFSNQMPLPNGSTTAGLCCTPDVCPSTSCGQITDHCTGQVKSCACGAGSHCNSANSMCVGNDNCTTLGAGGNGQQCSNGPAFSDQGIPPTLLTCQCTTPSSTCSKNGAVVTGNTIGTCCQNTTTCGTQCNVTLTNSCTGDPIVCGSTCNGTGTCSAGSNGTCVPYKNCSQQMPPADGSEGAKCSIDANGSFPRYPFDPTGQTCGCAGGRVCAVVGPPKHAAGSGELGTCCTNTASCNGQCGTTVTDTCTGATIICGCDSAHHCASGTCAVNATCGGYGAGGGIGAKCSTVASGAFPDGPNGMNLTCPCSTGGGLANNTCVGSSASTAGTCQCTPKVPTTCGDDGQSDGCGGTMSMPCGSPMVCFQNACCSKAACGARNEGDACGAMSTCGVSVNCDCTQMYMTCGAKTPGVCGCIRLDQGACGNQIPNGTIGPDGCGGFVQCGG